MTSLRILINIFSRGNTLKILCGIYVSKVFITAQLIEKPFSRLSIYKMEYLWNSKMMLNIYLCFMKNFSFLAQWKTNRPKFFIHI
jgi:hypothetical protein